MLEVPVDPDRSTQVSTPDTEGPRRYTQVRSQPDTYTSSMTGKRYEYGMIKLEIQGVINPDTHMFAHEDFYQAKPKVVIAIMNQLSLKSGSKEWGDKAHSATKSKMNQLQLRNTSIPMHRRDLTYEEHQMALESQMFPDRVQDSYEEREF